jgi:phosphonate transport system ATP-binding protein
MPLFELRNASAAYSGAAVLHDISLSIERGERVALVGKSGAGKSTLLSLLYGQHQDDAALVPQELGLVHALSVFHNVYMGRLHRHGTLYNVANLIRPLRREIASVSPVIERLGLVDKLFAPVGELSGGQQQRTAVGRAMFKGSPIFLGDEPVSAVDEHQSRDVLATIVDSHETVVLSMHDVGLALAFSGRVVGLRDGRIALDRPTGGLNSSDLDDLYRA